MPNKLRTLEEVLGVSKQVQIPEAFVAETIRLRLMEQIPVLIQAVTQEVLAAVPKPERGESGTPGYTPRKGIDYFDGLDGRDGKDSRVPGPQGLPGRDGSPDTSVEIRNKLQSLKGEERLDASAIKNLPMELRLGGGIHRGGIKLESDVILEGTIDGTNTEFTVPTSKSVPKSRTTRLYLNGQRLTLNTHYTHSNRTFTFTSAPPQGSESPIVDYEGQ